MSIYLFYLPLLRDTYQGRDPIQADYHAVVVFLIAEVFQLHFPWPLSRHADCELRPSILQLRARDSFRGVLKPIQLVALENMFSEWPTAR